MKFFSKIFVLVLFLFCSRIQIRTNLCSFSIRNGSTMMTPDEVHRFSPKFHVSAPKMALGQKFSFRWLFYFVKNLDSHKFVQLFDWRWVNKEDSVRDSSFFGQIPSFRPPKWLFCKNFSFGAHFILH